MKKFFMIMIAFLSVAISASAQTDNFGNHKFFDNWSIGTDGGVSTNLHDWDMHRGGVWGVQLTKGVTPVVSFEFSSQLGFNDNANWNVAHSKNAVDNVTVLGSTKVNLMNLIGGYKGKPRIFEIQARGGVGYMRSFYGDVDGLAHGRTDVNRAVGKLGLDFDFNVGKQRAWTLSLRPAVVLKGQNGDAWCDNGECTKYTHNGLGQLTAGVSYHFKTSNGTHNFATIEPTVVTKIVENVIEREKIVEVEKVVEKVAPTVVNEVTVPFGFNSAELTARAKHILDGLTAEKVAVKGYASFEPKTSREHNQLLSENRANAVATYLIDRGITVVSSEGLADAIDGRIAVVTVQ